MILFMEITFLGHSSFKIKGKKATVITDPFDEVMVGFKFPRTEANVVTISHNHKDHNCLDKIDGSPFVISRPGEYEISEVSIIGKGAFHDNNGGTERGENIIYLIEIDNLRILHLGDLGHKLTDENIADFGVIDIIMIPVGGEATIGPKEAVDVIAKTGPKIVIPMHFKEEGINEEVFGSLLGVSNFLKEMGSENLVPQPKLIVSTLDIPEQLQVVTLERKSG